MTVEDKEKTTVESSESTIEDTKQELAEAYVDFLDKQKEGIIATTAGFGANINPLKQEAVEYLITDTKKEKGDIFSNIGKNIKKKFMEKLTGGTFIEYNKASLNKMKALITQYKNDQTKLQELIIQIGEEKDPTIENIPPTSNDVVTPTAVVVATPIVTEVYDKTKYKDPIEVNDAKITSKFGKRKDPVTGKEGTQHNGIDISAPKNTPIHSVISGKVIENKRDAHGGGNYISIQGDDGRIYSYLHLNKPSALKIGDRVQAGDEIGKVGSTGKSTGPHLHLLVKENDKPVDPIAVLPGLFDNYEMAA